ncbi:MAG: tetratricopeptide repeat protein [Planctomycetaceae bacterium]|nr:tetratricopeptide repeat protein [Planctomycetaceae bacterium]
MRSRQSAKTSEGCRRLPAAALLLSLGAACLGAGLANRDKQGLRSYTIEGVLRLPDEEIDIGTAALILSREWGTTKTTHVYRAKIDEYAEAILERIRNKHMQPDYRAIEIVNEYLFEEQKFTSVDNAENPNDLFLHTVLEKKKGYCLSLSVLYLAVCERLGMPVYGVVVPSHFFVRYDDGSRKYNIETTSKGAIVGDDYYIEKFRPPLRDTGLYMKNLTPRQTLGCFFNNLGNSYMETGDTEKAFEVLQRAVEINPLLSEANMNLGNIYLQKNMPLQAIRQYRNALDILGDDAKIMNNIGSAYMQMKDYLRAESCYRVAMGLDPEYGDARRNLAQTLQAQGEVQEAVSLLRAAVVLEPKNAENAAMLGILYRELKEYPDAQKYLLKALDLSPQHSQARLALGFLYLDKGRFEPAIDAFQAALAYDRTLAAAWFGLGQAYNAQGQEEEQIQAYEQAIAFDPSMAAAYQNLGNAYLRQERVSEAIALYRRGLAAEPLNTGLRYNLAAALAKTEMHDEALIEYLEIMRQDPRDAKACNGAAISYYFLKQYDSAKLYALKAKELGFDVQQVLLDLK